MKKSSKKKTTTAKKSSKKKWTIIVTVTSKCCCPSNPMGKKSRSKTQKSGGPGMSATASSKEMANLIAELLQKCSIEAPSASEEWQEYVEIRSLVEKIRKKQKGMSVVFEGCRHSHFQDLVSWAKTSGASCDGFRIANFGKEGYGLQATRDIKAEELFLCIPRKMLMTTESAQKSILGPLLRQDRILKAMGNVSLALHLLCERANPTSMWVPYIRSLPHEYTTPLYYELEEVQLLLGTQAVQDVFNQFKNTARQYAYFYKLLQSHPTAGVLPLKECFTFDDYRWAVSSVMTRQNQIPTEDGSQVTQALIPLWDMCNHTNGMITTGYNLEDDRCECVALRNYKENEQIYIFYGTRSNADFFVHNGFFFQDNLHDRVKIKLGISKSERLYAMKAEVLARAGIPVSAVITPRTSPPPATVEWREEGPNSRVERGGAILKLKTSNTVLRNFQGSQSRTLEAHSSFQSIRQLAGDKEHGKSRSCVFALHLNEFPVSAQLLAFLRVFCMTEEELKDSLVEDSINKILNLSKREFPVSWENEIKLWTFLETRVALLLKNYRTTSEEDRAMLQQPDLSPHARAAINLRLAEKQILLKCLASGQAQHAHFEKNIAESLPLPCCGFASRKDTNCNGSDHA
ncbi:actin-histidine N-methyltransferase isoform X1 [Corythoichthys intestinalis]|uniref:actin-histidine N-methyltransferase isoform X1 n=1 Tax=Corythoichthys intestinalis TaxID=161448 RepID=UPI0025A686AF|nr:actin-histidine N-methyltransferase isoform X1 [Corythoichthys intestinalis]